MGIGGVGETGTEKEKGANPLAGLSAMGKDELRSELIKLRRRYARLEKTATKAGEAGEAQRAAHDEQVKTEAILGGLGVGVIIQDLDYRVMYENPFQQAVTGSHIGELCYQAFEGLDRACEGCPMRLSISDGGIHKGYREIKTQERTKHFELITTPLRDSEGRIVGGIKVVRDITDLRAAQAEAEGALAARDSLLLEIHHRVKNNMQIISSIIRRQERHAASPEVADALSDVQGRIRSMALAHEKLFYSPTHDSINMDEYVRDLAVHLVQSFPGSKSKGVEIKLEVEPISVSAETAIPCGLIVNEAVSNALKHAFGDGRTGAEVCITLRREDWGGLLLEVRDNGSGLPPGLDIRNSVSVGLDLMAILAEQQLRGEFEIERTGGTTVRVLFKELEYKKRF